MFVLLLTYIVPIEQVDAHVEAHREFLKRHYAAGNFVVSGAQVPRTGGVIIAKVAGGKDAVHAIIAEDPFYREGVATYDVIEFAPMWTAEGLEWLKG